MVWPYLGGTVGYYLSYAASADGNVEASRPGFGIMAGIGIGIENVTIVLEVRGTVAPEAEAPGNLGVQPGGIYALAGITYALEPDKHPGDARTDRPF